MDRLETHYETLRARDGTETAPVKKLPDERLARTFVAADGDVTALTDANTFLATGIGMTGPPHLGTLGQILTMARLQRAGVDVGFVLADLEPYHRGHPLDRVRDLADRYREFISECGFAPSSTSECAGLRTQQEAHAVMHTANLLAPYYDGSRPRSADSTAWEEAVQAAYDAGAVTTDGPTSEAAAHHSGVLHLADFLHPFRHGYDRVVLGFGADEHGLTAAARALLAAAPDSLISGAISGLYARLVAGLGDAPKMGRSLPGSAVHLGMTPERIREHLTSPATDAAEPGDSIAFQAMCLAGYDADELERRERACREGGAAWAQARAEYAAFVADRAVRWQATE